jgi:Uma2 family endonuclease
MRSPIYHFSISEYLEAEAKSQIRHEYIDGQVFAMAGGSKTHNRIAVNLIALFRPHLRGTKCEVYMADVKVKLKSKLQNKTIFYYPDLLVSCDSEDQDQFIVDSPCLIIEVLSPSTEMTDRREKLINYQTIPSLQEYVLIAQDEIKVEVYRQELAQTWTKEILGADHDLILNSINLTLKMTEIYENIF